VVQSAYKIPSIAIRIVLGGCSLLGESGKMIGFVDSRIKFGF
jgi:ribose/xylose/arabinose/galactoside ABC-type transport system permease subunit